MRQLKGVISIKRSLNLVTQLVVFCRHEAERTEQEARGRLERQKITDEAEAERSRRNLLELQSQSAAIESTGQAKAEAQSRAEAARIEGEAAVEQARLKADAMEIEAVSAPQFQWSAAVYCNGRFLETWTQNECRAREFSAGQTIRDSPS